MPTIGNTSSTTSAETAGPVDLTHTVASGTDLLLAFHETWGLANTYTVTWDPSGANESMTILVDENSALGDGTGRRVFIAYRVNPTAATAVVRFASTSNQIGIYGACDVETVETATPFGTAQQTSATTGTSSSLTVSDAGDNDLIIDLIGVRGGDITNGADQNNEINQNTSNHWGDVTTQLGSVSGDEMTHTFASDDNAHVAVAIKAPPSTAVLVPSVQSYSFGPRPTMMPSGHP